MRSWLIVVTVMAAVWTAGCVDAPGFRCSSSVQCGGAATATGNGEITMIDLWA